MISKILILTVLSITGQTDEVGVAELKSVWSETRIPRVKLDYERKIERFVESSSGPFGEASPGEPTDTFDKGRFARDAELGMFLSTSHRVTNLLDGKGVSVSPEAPGFDMSGLNTVKIEPEGETSIQRNATAIEFLHWIDPLETKLYSKIANLQGNFEIRNDAQFGRVVDIVIPGRSQQQTVTLSEQLQWRVVDARVNVNGAPRTRSTYVYGSASPLKLAKVETQLFSPNTGALESRMVTTIDNIKFECVRADLELLPPPHSVVADRTNGSTVRYILRRDGSRRNYDHDERRLANSWDELIQTEEAPLMGMGRLLQPRSLEF